MNHPAESNSEFQVNIRAAIMTLISATPTQCNSEEEDELHCNVKKFKESNGARGFSQPRKLVSYKDSLVGDILGAYEQALRFDKDWEEKYESDTELEPLLEGMAEVKLSKETKACIRVLWSKALIVKVATPTQCNSEEEDELHCNVKKFKESNGARSFSQPRKLVSYKDSLVGDILGAYEQALRFDKDWEEKYESDTELEPLLEGMAEVKLSKETKACIRVLWSKALIVKVYDRSVGFNYLTFKINTLWKPKAKMDCVNLGCDFFLIRFSSSKDYDHVLLGGPWFIGEHSLAIMLWEPYFKTSKAKFSLVAVWIRLPEYQ
nr:hypothetical protein CFP56_15653 [Quercus suber]